MTMGVEKRQHRPVELELVQIAAATVDPRFTAIIEQQRGSAARRLARPDMGQRGALARDTLDQAFDASTAGFAPEQTRRNDPRVIKNHQVAGLEKAGQLGKNA